MCLTLQVDLYQPELLLHDHRLHMAEWEMMKVVAASCHCKRLCLPLQATCAMHCRMPARTCSAATRTHACAIKQLHSSGWACRVLLIDAGGRGS